MRLGFFSRVGHIIFPLFFVHQKKTWWRAADTKEIICVLVLLTGVIALRTGDAFPLNTMDTYSRGILGRGLDAEDLDVRIEAFNADGVSLGEDDSTWTIESIEFGNLTTRLAYHPNASYYIVGDNDTMVVEFWHPYWADIGGGDIAAVHLIIAADYVFSCRENGVDTLSVKVVNAGWYNVTEDPMDCEDEGGNGCPALVLTDTTNIVHRYINQDAENLDGFMTDWALAQGWVMTDDFVEYYAYDLTIDGKWIGVPLISDIRILAYNRTTFDTYNISKPFGPEGMDPWEWEDFVVLAKELTEATDRPGWYFQSMFDEEMKLSMMIGRNWGSTLYREEEDNDDEYKCALDDNFVTAMNLTIEVMLEERSMRRAFALPYNYTEELWESGNHRCLGTVLPANSSEMWGMAIVSPRDVSNCDEDIAIAHVPGKYGYLGGTGLFIGTNASEDQQAHAWGLAQLMMMNASSYAKLQQSPPPFEKLLQNKWWKRPEWCSKVTQLRKSVPTQYPQHGTYNFLEIQKENPFRDMWMEMAEGVDASAATQHVVEVVDELLEIECTEDNYELAGCRTCDRDEYDYNMSSCDPRTQCHTVIFFASPSEEDGDCYSDGNTELLVSCDHVEVTSGFGIAIILASCLGGLLALASAALVIRYRHRPFIKFSQPTFCVFFSLGVAGLCLSNLALVGPNTTTSCMSRFAFPGIAFDLAFGALFSKVYRVRWVVANVTSGRGRSRNKRKSFLPVVGVVSLALVVDLIILAAWVLGGEYGPVVTEERARKFKMDMTECAADMSSYAIVFFTLKVALIGWGVYLAWVTRNINYTLVEGREMSWSIYLFAVLSAILILVSHSNLKIEYWALARAFVFCLSSCTALVMVLVPKLWAAHRGKDVNMSVLTSSATSACVSRRYAESAGGGFGIGSLGVSTTSGCSGEPLAVICMHCNKLTAPVLVTDAFGMNLAGGTAKRPDEPEGVDAPPPSMAVNQSDWVFSAGAAATSDVPPNRPAHSLRPLQGMFDVSSVYPSADDLMCYCPGLIGISSETATKENLNEESEEWGDRSPAPLANSRSLSASASLVESGRCVAAPGEVKLCRLASKGRVSELPFPMPRSSSLNLSIDVAARSPPIYRGSGDGGGSGVGHVGEVSSTSSWRGSIRSSWRRSFPSNFSSGSAYSDLNPASFQRSLMAQAAVIRAALWGPNTSVSQPQTGGRVGNGWSSTGSSRSRRSRGNAGDRSDAEILAGELGERGKSNGNSETSDPSSASSSAVVSEGRPPLPRQLGLSPRELEGEGYAGREKSDGLREVEGAVEVLPLEGYRESNGGRKTSRGLVIPAVFGSRNKKQDNLGRANDGSSSGSGSPAPPGRITSEVSMTSIGMSSAASESSVYPTENDSVRLLDEDYVIPLTSYQSGSEIAVSPLPFSVNSNSHVSTDARGELVGQRMPPENDGQDSPPASLQSLTSFSETNHTVEASADIVETSAMPTKLSKSTHLTLVPTVTSEDGKCHGRGRPLSPIPDNSESFTTGEASDREGSSDGQQQDDVPRSLESLRSYRQSKFCSRQNSLAYSSSMDGSGHHAFGDTSGGITTPTPINSCLSDQPGEWTPTTSRSSVSRHSSGRFGGIGGRGQMSRAFSFTVSDISLDASDVEVTPARSRTRVEPCLDSNGRISAPVSMISASPQRSARSRSPGNSGVGACPKGTPARPYRRSSSSSMRAPRWGGNVDSEDATGYSIAAAGEANSGGASRTAEDKAVHSVEEGFVEVERVPAEVLEGEVCQPAETLFESNDSTRDSLTTSRRELAKWLEAPSGSSRSWNASPSEKEHAGNCGKDLI